MDTWTRSVLFRGGVGVLVVVVVGAAGPEHVVLGVRAPVTSLLSTSRVAFAALGPPVADRYGSVLWRRLRAAPADAGERGSPGAVLQRRRGDGGETDLLVRRRLGGLG